MHKVPSMNQENLVAMPEGQRSLAVDSFTLWSFC
jgi:hypothetical protein